MENNKKTIIAAFRLIFRPIARILLFAGVTWKEIAEVAASMATNQFHMWAHATSVPASVRWLQRLGLVLSPERHARHHCGEFDRSYCMTSGWLNPLLDRIDLFGRIERRIRGSSGASP